MKNKDKYDLRKLIFLLHYDVFVVELVYENEYIAEISCGKDNPIKAIMEWLERDEEND